MMTTTLQPKARGPADGLRLQSGPGRDSCASATGDDTGPTALDHFVVEVAPDHGRPSLHGSTTGRADPSRPSGRVQVSESGRHVRISSAAGAFMPAGLPHASLNRRTRRGGRRRLHARRRPCFYEELGPRTRDGEPSREAVAACFERHGMTLLGPPLAASGLSTRSTEEADARIRTADPFITSEVLYQLSYVGSEGGF